MRVVRTARGLDAMLAAFSQGPDVAAAVVDDEHVAMAEACLAAGTDVFTAVSAGGAQAEQLVRDAAGRARCLAAVTQCIAGRGSDAQRTAIEQAVDELVMNALYDAPVGADGEPLFRGIATRERLQMRTTSGVRVRYVRKDDRFTLAVRDQFGTLARDTVIRHIDKSLHAADPVDRKTGGAGLGLYLVFASATSIWFDVRPGASTEVVCVFSLSEPGELAMWGHLVGAPAAAPRRDRIVDVRRTRRLMAGSAALLAAGVSALVLWPRTPPETVQLEVASDPAGAYVTAGGSALGIAPVRLTKLAPGAPVEITLTARGYVTRHVVLHAPEQGSARVVEHLARSPDFVTLQIVSDPAGAEVRRDGDAAGADRTYTPAELVIEASVPQKFVVTMPGRRPAVVGPLTAPPGSAPMTVRVELPPQ